MIAHIVRVWPSDTRVNIIVRDTAGTAIESMCFVFLPEGHGIAALCEAAAWNGRTQPPPLVLTLEPKTRYGYKIIDAELLAETRNASTYIDEPETPAAPVQPQGTLAEVQMEIDRYHGTDWKDI